MARAKSPSSAGPAPKSDAYVGLLFISLCAQATAAIFFYLDWSAYPAAKPNAPAPISVQLGGGAAAPAPAPAPGAAMMGGMP